MTVEETIALVKAMKESGVASFKHGDMEFSFTPGAATTAPLNINDAPQEVKHKIEEFTSLLKLDDKDILDRMFPEPKEDEAMQ